jgi:hypothetical protein
MHEDCERNGPVKVIVVGGKVLDKPLWVDPSPIERTLQRELFTPARRDVFRREREAKVAEKEARRKGLIL